MDPLKLKMMITKAVIVHITTVSINGSNSATKPSDAAYFVFTAEWAIDADPAPASLEKAALLNPTNKTPIILPTPMAVGLNASFRIKAKALSTNEKLVPIIYMHAIKYNTAMNGTIFSVTEAILLIPPIIINKKPRSKVKPSDHTPIELVIN